MIIRTFYSHLYKVVSQPPELTTTKLNLMIEIMRVCGRRANAANPLSEIVRPNCSILNNRKGQLYQCAMIKPRPGLTACLITVKPSPSKFNWNSAELYPTNTLQFNYSVLKIVTSPNEQKQKKNYFERENCSVGKQNVLRRVYQNCMYTY